MRRVVPAPNVEPAKRVSGLGARVARERAADDTRLAAADRSVPLAADNRAAVVYALADAAASEAVDSAPFTVGPFKVGRVGAAMAAAWIAADPVLSVSADCPKPRKGGANPPPIPAERLAIVGSYSGWLACTFTEKRALYRAVVAAEKADGSLAYGRLHHDARQIGALDCIAALFALTREKIEAKAVRAADIDVSTLRGRAIDRARRHRRSRAAAPSPTVRPDALGSTLSEGGRLAAVRTVVVEHTAWAAASGRSYLMTDCSVDARGLWVAGSTRPKIHVERTIGEVSSYGAIRPADTADYEPAASAGEIPRHASLADTVEPGAAPSDRPVIVHDPSAAVGARSTRCRLDIELLDAADLEALAAAHARRYRVEHTLDHARRALTRANDLLRFGFDRTAYRAIYSRRDLRGAAVQIDPTAATA